MFELTEYNVLFDACEVLGLEVRIYKINKKLGLGVLRDGDLIWRRVLRDSENLEDAASMAITHLRDRGVHVA